jgi:hypothetical protein
MIEQSLSSQLFGSAAAKSKSRRNDREPQVQSSRVEAH